MCACTFAHACKPVRWEVKGKNVVNIYCLIRSPSLIFLEKDFVLLHLHGEEEAVFTQYCPVSWLPNSSSIGFKLNQSPFSQISNSN